MRPELELLFGRFRVIARGALAVVLLTVALTVIAVLAPSLVGM
jgi:hypothetical protein